MFPVFIYVVWQFGQFSKCGNKLYGILETAILFVLFFDAKAAIFLKVYH